MRSLMFLRHAKAEPQGRRDDFGRKLTSAGECDASMLGSFCRDQHLTPDLALVSSSARTRQTFDNWAGTAGRPAAVRYEDALYNATADDLRSCLRLIDPTVRSLLFVAHNPGIMEAAIASARDGDIVDLDRLKNRFPPCALAVVTFDTDDWHDAWIGGGRLDYLLLPEDLVSRS